MKLVVEAIDLLDSMELATAADAGLYKRASHLARELDQHLFDTLYHALALDRWSPPAEESRA